MMARLHNAGVDVNVSDVLAGHGEAKKDACDVMAIELRVVFVNSFDKHPISERLQVLEVQLLSPVPPSYRVCFVVMCTLQLCM